MNKKSYQTPIVRVVALRAAAIICTSPGQAAQVHNTVGRSDTQYSRSTSSWDDDE